MSATTSPSARETDALALPASRSISDRIAAVLPLTSVYVVLCFVYLVEAWNRVTPWLFTDELELTQLSRSIADTGRAARRGTPHSADSLYTYLTAPVWLIQDVARAYAGVKYLDVFVMAAVVFPTYFLARLVVRRGWALFAAAAAGAIPALAYSSYIVEETLAYPYAALCFFLMAKALVEGRRGRRPYGWAIAAVVASLVAPSVRSELVVVPIALALALFFAWWSSDRARRRRATWSIGDWIGAITLGFGAVFLISAIGSHHSLEWYSVTTYYKHRIIVMGDWAAGALAIGIGVIPFIGGLAALFRAPGEERSREVRMFRCVTLAGLVAVGMYAAMKAAYLSTVFATRVEERNLIYVAPLLFVGTALILDRRRVNVWALVGATAYAAYLVGYALYHPTQFPYEMNVQLYSDALGLAILQQANRYLYWTPDTARWVLLGLAAAGLLAFLAVGRLRPRVAGLVAAALALGIVGWSLTGEISAAAGTNSISRTAAATLRHPFTWVDDVAHGRPTIYLGQGEADQNPEWMLEFWNRSIVTVGSLDGTVDGPGPAGSPNLTADGTIYWTADPANPGREYAYAVEDWPCVDFAGTYRGVHYYRAGGGTRAWRLIQLTQPNRLRAMCTGIYPDGWSGAADSQYFRFSEGKGGWLRIVVSRRDWGGPTPPTAVHVLLAPLVILPTRQPALSRTSREIDLSVGDGQTRVCWLRAPAARFGAAVVVVSKFVPHQIDPNLSDPRVLGAQVDYRFTRKAPPPSATPNTCR
ncbi:MAG TPA: hypothetical protein VMT74_03780 [Gaiellaceae bacterium]|nr:hypothetical protein [Gaiellaceae bacterium]